MSDQTLMYLAPLNLFTLFISARYLTVFVRFAMNCRSNPRLSWSCIWLLLTTAQEAQSDVTDVSLQKTSTQTITEGSDFNIPSIGAITNESLEVGDNEGG